MNKNTKNNQHYFKISQENPETNLDSFYVFDERHAKLDEYIKATKTIKNILITIKTLVDTNEDQKVINRYFLTLQESLSEFANCSEFICFVNACDNTLDAVRRDFGLIKKITQKYFAKRSLNELVPAEWVQAILDVGSSRKKGKCGEQKLVSISTRLGYNLVKNWQDFFDSKKCMAQFSKVFSMKAVRNNLGVKIKTKKQGKKLDLIIKCRNKIFLVEAKHLNTSGGGQDKQISEMIEILNLKETNTSISYVAFLDGSYSNILISDSKCGAKLSNQRKEIQRYLKRIPSNYWLNTAGFKSLFADLAK